MTFSYPSDNKSMKWDFEWPKKAFIDLNEMVLLQEAKNNKNRAIKKPPNIDKNKEHDFKTIIICSCFFTLCTA